MIYNYIRKIDSNATFIYLSIIVFIIYIVSKIIKPSMYNIIGLIFGIIIVYYLNDKNKTTLGYLNEQIETRMLSLRPKPSYFHLDTDIIDIFYNTRDFRKYHREGYDNALMCTDNLLSIVYSVKLGVNDCFRNYDIAREQYEKAMNHYQSIIHHLPTQKVLLDKYQTSMNILQLLLRRHIDDIYKNCEETQVEKGINNRTELRYNTGPKANDTDKLEYTPNYYYF